MASRKSPTATAIARHDVLGIRLHAAIGFDSVFNRWFFLSCGVFVELQHGHLLRRLRLLFLVVTPHPRHPQLAHGNPWTLR